MKPKRWRFELIGLIAAAALSRLWDLFTPNSVVFDEVYFKAFAAHYLDGRYFFDIHPPLGKLLIAGFAHLSGLSPSAMLDGTAVSLRLLPAVAGIVLVPLMWGILRRLGASRPLAFMGAFLVLADNAVLVESRFILMDSMLLLFGLGSLYWYLVARNRSGHWRYFYLFLSALAAGAAASIKWTGLAALAVVGLMWLWDSRAAFGDWSRRLGELSLLVLVPLTLYVSVFWIHFHLLPKSGDGDAFMSEKFQATLRDNPGYDPNVHRSFGQKFIELNREMYQANQTLTATHPYGSRWYTWPLEQRPVYYWQGDALEDSRQGNIYLLGNPVIWWGVWLMLIIGLGYSFVVNRKLRPSTVAALSVAGVAYLINLLPFVAVSRVMFLYHYFFPFFFCLIFTVMLWNDLSTDKTGQSLNSPLRRSLFAVVLLAVTLGFTYFAPLTYGTLLSPAGLQARMWLPTWR